MKFTGLELFMEKLEQMIHGNYNPLINNHPSFLAAMPQLQHLYQELDATIQTLHLIDELPQVTNLKKRFKDAAEDAHDLVDLFVYHINLRNTVSLNKISASDPRRNNVLMVCLTNAVRGVLWGTDVCQQQSWLGWKLFSYQKFRKISLNLEDVMRSIKSINEEFITIQSNMKMDSCPRNDNIKTSIVVAETSDTKDPLGLRRKKATEDTIVGFDRHVELIRDKLVEDQKQLDVVSIVGMGGLGKTTLAAKVFKDRFIMYHFHVRGWVTVSQTYEKKDLLKQILESIGNKINNVGNQNYSELRQMLRKKLMCRRYLIVIDDIWNPEAWDALKLSFPNDDIGSRILLTSRIKEVALHAKSNGFIHRLEYLTEEESWELLCKKVFHGSNVCPKQLVEPGMKIARNCHGLPLTLVVVAGVLAKEPLRKDSWERIGQSVSSYLVSNETGSIETLAWSFDHLPGHLRDCYLYLGGFPEDHMFRVRRLIWLWMAEGFIQEDGVRSIEEIAKDHVIELVNRNLVIVTDWKSCGGIKSFYVHDLLRELCIKIATRENFYLKAQRTTRSDETYKQRRIFIENCTNVMDTSRIRSLFCFCIPYERRELIRNLSLSWILIMVLDLQVYSLDYFPEEISRLVHLRYLAISLDGDKKFPTSICKLWSLKILIIRNVKFGILKMPKAISDLMNLRHLMCEGYDYMWFPAVKKPMNLQTISGVRVTLGDGVESWVKCFPAIKKLSCSIQGHKKFDLQSLTSLEHLKLSRHWDTWELKFISFPPSLKSLTLQMCYLPWSDMSIIQLLPNLQVLKILRNAFKGSKWDTGEEQFSRLKFLKLYYLDIKEWEASSMNFPCLKQLMVGHCRELEEIPQDFGNIPTLEIISICHCKEVVLESLDTIQEEQHAQGNFELKIIKKYF